MAQHRQIAALIAHITRAGSLIARVDHARRQPWRTREQLYEHVIAGAEAWEAAWDELARARLIASDLGCEVSPWRDETVEVSPACSVDELRRLLRFDTARAYEALAQLHGALPATPQRDHTFAILTGALVLIAVPILVASFV
jgi:hypothetical protein